MATADGNSKCTITGDDGREYVFYFVKGGDNLLSVEVELNGELVGTPIRFKGAANRLAADLPGVSSDYFITDESGRITNG